MGSAPKSDNSAKSSSVSVPGEPRYCYFYCYNYYNNYKYYCDYRYYFKKLLSYTDTQMSDTLTSETATTIVSGEIFILVTPYIFLREHATAMHTIPQIYEYLN